MTSRTSVPPSAAPAMDRPWWQLGLAAGVIAAVINAVVYFLYQAVAGAPLQVTQPGGGALQDLPVVLVTLMSIIPPVVASVLAYALSRWTRSARTWLIAISVILAVLSLLSPLGLPAEVSTGNKLTLAAMHLIVAGAALAALVPRLFGERA